MSVICVSDGLQIIQMLDPEPLPLLSLLPSAQPLQQQKVAIEVEKSNKSDKVTPTVLFARQSGRRWAGRLAAEVGGINIWV